MKNNIKQTIIEATTISANNQGYVVVTVDQYRYLRVILSSPADVLGDGYVLWEGAGGLRVAVAARDAVLDAVRPLYHDRTGAAFEAAKEALDS